MRYAVTTWRIAEHNADHTEALKAWRTHCEEAHPQIKGIRCYMLNGGTEYHWLEEFVDYNAYQELVSSVDDACASVMRAVMKHAVPGTMRTGIWMDAIP